MSALRNACAVLRLLGKENSVLTVSSVAAQLDWPKSTVSRLLAMMAQEGLLEPMPGGRGYRAGALVFNAGNNFRAGSTLLDELGVAVAALVAEFGHTGYVSMRDGQAVYAVRMIPGRTALRVMRSVGERLAAHGTATGRSLLVRLQRPALLDLYRDGLPPVRGAAPQSLGALITRLDAIAANGVEEALDEANPGVGSVAAAIADPVNGEMAAICLSFPVSEVGATERATIRARVAAAASSLGLRFGDPFWRDQAA